MTFSNGFRCGAPDSLVYVNITDHPPHVGLCGQEKNTVL